MAQQHHCSRAGAVEKLSSALAALPDDQIVEALTAATGRPGYGARTLLRAYLASFFPNTTSISAALRLIADDPRLAAVVGGTPTKYAVSRFVSKLAEYPDLLEQVTASLTSDISEFLPRLGQIVALDSTDLKAWSGSMRSDPDANSSAKLDTKGKLKWWYGYKAHVICDAEYELPLVSYVTRASDSDFKQVEPSLARLTESPMVVLADAGYDSEANRRIIERHNAMPIIKRNKRRGKVQKPTTSFKLFYDKRTAIERMFGRLKDFRRLNRLTLKTLPKVTVHVLCAVLTLLLRALATLLLNEPDLIRCSV